MLQTAGMKEMELGGLLSLAPSHLSQVVSSVFSFQFLAFLAFNFFLNATTNKFFSDSVTVNFFLNATTNKFFSDSVTVERNLKKLFQRHCGKEFKKTSSSVILRFTVILQHQTGKPPSKQ